MRCSAVQETEIEPQWSALLGFPLLWADSNENGGACAGPGFFKKYISWQLSWDSWTWAGRELQSTVPLGECWAYLLALWWRRAVSSSPSPGSPMGTLQWCLWQADAASLDARCTAGVILAAFYSSALQPCIIYTYICYMQKYACACIY